MINVDRVNSQNGINGDNNIDYPNGGDQYKGQVNSNNLNNNNNLNRRKSNQRKWNNNKSKNGRNQDIQALKRQIQDLRSSISTNNRNSSGMYNQSRSPSLRSTSYATMNLSVPLVTGKHYNQNVISNTFRYVKDQTIQLDFKIKPIKERLEIQAELWARRIIDEQELYLRKIMDVYRENWLETLIKCYIYSYYSSILYALTDSRVAEISFDRVLVYGHAITYYALLRPSFTFEHDGYFVKYRFIHDDKDLTTLYNQARQYDYISNYLITSPRFYLENEYLDRILAGLREYMPESGPKFSLMINNTLENYLTKDNFPLINSFYKENSKQTEWFYCYEKGRTVLDDSTLFGKAVFVTAIKNSDCNAYFDSNTEDDAYYLCKYELSSIASTMYPNYVKSEKS